MKKIIEGISRVWSVEAKVLPQVGFWVSADNTWVAYARDWHTICVINISTGKTSEFKTKGKVQWFSGGARQFFALWGGAPPLIDTSSGTPVELPWQRPARHKWVVNDAASIDDRQLVVLADLSGPTIHIIDAKTLDDISSTSVKTDLTENLMLVLSQKGSGYLSSPEGECSEITPFSISPSGDVKLAYDRCKKYETAFRVVDSGRLLVTYSADTASYSVYSADLKNMICEIPEIVEWNGIEYSLCLSSPVWLSDGFCLFSGGLDGATYRRPFIVNILDCSIIGDIVDHFTPVKPVPDYEPFFSTSLDGPRFIRYTGERVELWRYRPGS